jgi:putative redox protein
MPSHPEVTTQTATPPRRINHAHVEWVGGKHFDAGRPGGGVARFDSSGVTGPGPVDALLSALAVCAAEDVIEILHKRRTPVEHLTIDAAGERANEVPARLIGAKLTYHITGAGIDRANAERAVDLALGKYCSVRRSLDPTIPIEFAVTLNGEAGHLRPIGGVTP